MRYETILFDLDGMLVDPRVGITRCVEFALARCGFEIADPDILTPYIGPPLTESVARLHGLDAFNRSRLSSDKLWTPG